MINKRSPKVVACRYCASEDTGVKYHCKKKEKNITVGLCSQLENKPVAAVIFLAGIASRAHPVMTLSSSTMRCVYKLKSNV